MADLTVVISGDTRGLSRSTRTAARDVDRFARDVDRSGKRVNTALGSMTRVAAGTAAAFGPAVLGLAVKKAVDEFREAEKVGKQTEAVLKSTKSAAKVTADEVARMAEKLSLVSGQDDELIQKGANVLLTFTRIRNEVGQGNQVFSQALRLAVDMSAALDQDLKSSVIQLGKALNDPTVGLTALRRVGVSFTDSQVELIKRLTESGRQLEAQKLILRELRREFAGSARANADAMDRLGVAIDNLFEKFGAKLAPIIQRAATRLVRFIIQMDEGRGAGGRFARTMSDVAQVTGQVIKIFGAVIPVVIAVGRRVTILNQLLIKGLVAAWRAVINIVSNFGQTVTDVWGKVKGATQSGARFVSNAFDRIGDVASKVAGPVRTIVNLIRSLARAASSLGGAAKGVVDFLNPFGDGVGFDTDISNIFVGGGGGAFQFKNLAAQFGLTVSSGFRPGDITSSGNPSYHSMGSPSAPRAVDYSGSTAGMMAFARLMSTRFGPRLKELIHTPLGGLQVKNGEPYIYTGEVAADHYDHVHVALRRGGGVPGRGSGDRVPAMLEPGEFVVNRRAAAAAGPALAALNRGIPRFQQGGAVLAARAAQQAGFRGGTLVRMVAEAGGESSYNPRAVGDGGNSKGLWQIYLPAHPWAAGLNLFDPFVNARAAKRIFDSQGVGAWHADHRPFVGIAQRAVAALTRGGGGGGGGGGSRGGGGGGPGARGERLFGGGVSGPGLQEGPGSAGIGSGGMAVRRALATRAFARAERTPGIEDDEKAAARLIKVIKDEIRHKKRRLRKINRALRRRLRRKTRSRLLAEKAQLIDDIGGLEGEIQGVRDDLAGRGETATGGDAGGGAAEAPTSVGETFAAFAAGITGSFADEAALARLTPGLGDDLAALRGQTPLLERLLAAALRTRDAGAIAAAANALADNRDAIEALTGTIAEQNRIQQERMDLDRQLVQNQQALINIANVQGPSLIAAVIAAVNGGIGGKVGLGSQTPSFAGLGGLARY